MSADILGPTWNVTQKGLEILTENDTIKEKSKILQNALDTDLKEIGAPVINKFQSKSITTDAVLQIQKIRNISAPKANEKSQAAPRMLKFVLTDGENYIQAIEHAPITAFNPDKISPGSKLLVKSAQICSGYILLTPQNCTLLGGKVQAMYEKWALTRSMLGQKRQTLSVDGPPAWVNFGCKVQTDKEDTKFQSLASKEVKENTQFDQQRQGAIAEATTGAVKKVFGGGAKQPVQASNQPPQRRNNHRENREKRNENAEFEEQPTKPTDRVSLFSFLEDKIPDVPQIPAQRVDVPKSAPVNQYDRRYNNRNRYEANQNNHQDYRNEGRNYNRNKYEGNQNNHQDYKNFAEDQRGRNYNQNRFEGNHNNQQQYSTEEQKGRSYNRNANKSAPQRRDPPDKRSSHYNDHNNRNNYDNNSREIQSAPKPVPTETKQKTDVNELTNQLDKVNLNNSNKQFASRSLKQHLDLEKKRDEETSTWKWKVGDDCLAKYWEDGRYYDANITAVTDKTCVVQFRGYNNIEEVLQAHCLPVEKEPPKNEQRRSNNTRVFSRRQ